MYGISVNEISMHDIFVYEISVYEIFVYEISVYDKGGAGEEEGEGGRKEGSVRRRRWSNNKNPILRIWGKILILSGLGIGNIHF